MNHLELNKNKILTGVLILNGKTFGNVKNKKYYRCKPYDKNLPDFLILYEDKCCQFNKKKINKYILFSYSNYNSKLPIGTLKNVIGNVDNVENYIEYELYIHELNHYMKNFIKSTHEAINQLNVKDKIKSLMSKYDIVDRSTHNVITIDSHKCMYFDDAFEFKRVNLDSYKLSVYITNVSIWMDEFNLWNKLSDRISNIYVPSKLKLMLPNILLEKFCNLQQEQKRICIYIDMTMACDALIELDIGIAIISVTKNYVYDELSLLNNNMYYNTYISLAKHQEKNNIFKPIENSKDVVAYMMIIVNINVAKILKQNKTGIYRIVKCINNMPEYEPNIKHDWVDYVSEYGLYNERNQHIYSKYYVHFTSPMRRIVDLINQVELLNIKGHNCGGLSVINEWKNKIEYINKSTKIIKKIENKTFLYNNLIGSDYMVVYGYVFDIDKKDELYFHNIYIKEHGIIYYIRLKHKLTLFSTHKFKIFLFNEGENYHKKVQLQLLN